MNRQRQSSKELAHCYREVFEQSRDGVVIVSPNGRILDANRAYCRLLGYSLDELRALPDICRFAGEDGCEERAEEILARQLRKQGDLGAFETQYRRKDGTVLPVEVSFHAVEGGGGQIEYLTGTARDITVRRQLMAAVTESHAGLLAIFDGIDEPVYVADPHTYEILFVNRAIRAMFGEPDDRKCYEYLQNRAAPCPFCTNDMILREYLGRSYVWEFQNTVNKRWYKCIDKAIPWPSGSLVRYEMAIDITDRKQAEEALCESRDLLNATQQLAKIGGWEWDVARRTMSWTEESYRIFGFEPGEIVPPSPFDSKHLLTFEDPKDRRVLDEAFQRCAETGEPYDLEFPVTIAQGRRLWIQTLARPVMRGQRIVKVLGIILDITDRKNAALEQERLQDQLNQVRKMESVGRLAGGIAHDFNNMLGVILGHAELALEKDGPGESLHHDLQQIKDAALHSADITRQLLAFARKQAIAPRRLDLNEAVAGMLKMLRRLIGEDVELNWRPGENLGAVKMDPSQLDQILANLCVNARDAIRDNGKITIETRAAVFDEAYCAVNPGFLPGRYVMLAVSDNGCGMDAETLANLFEPFFTTKRLGQGTGLGLATVYGIVKQNEGFINVYSEPGRGTTFKIYLARHTGGAEPPPQKAFAAPTALVGQETILLVEDEPAILSLTKTMLERFGYRVLAVATPHAALDQARDHSGEIHLLMTDLIMPEMNGRDLAAELMAARPDIKPLFMSGYTANVIAHHGILDEGVHFIQKPFTMQELASVVREVLAADS